MQSPEISIVMLTYNRKEFLARAIESVLAQKNCDFEFIIVNNGSTDGSLNLCESYAGADRRIRLINKEKGNIGSGRNAGIDAATGRFLSFVDDDDYMTDDMFAYLYDNALSADADISICGCYSDFGDRLETYYIFEETHILNQYQGVEELLKRQIYNSANPCKLFKRNLFDDVRYPETGRYDDIHTIYKVFANAKKTVVTGIPKYFFRKHELNNSSFIVTNQLTPDNLQEYMMAFRDRTAHLSVKIPEIVPMARYSEWSYMISMVDRIDQNALASCDAIRQTMMTVLQENKAAFSNCVYQTERDRLLISRYLTI